MLHLSQLSWRKPESSSPPEWCNTLGNTGCCFRFFFSSFKSFCNVARCFSKSIAHSPDKIHRRRICSATIYAGCCAKIFRLCDNITRLLLRQNGVALTLNADLMSRTSYTNLEVPANTVIYFTSEYLTTITMSVSYMPSNLTLYYGISRYNNGSGNHWANSATGGSGSATITPGTTRSYYLYLANGNSKVMYVDVNYTALASLKLG